MTHDDAGWKKQMERREALTKQIEARLFKLYDTLKEKRRGVGVVNVKSETCQGCFLNIPPQMYIEVQKNNALIQCPNCNRILYWDGNGEMSGLLLMLHIDGASKGNPGRAGVGICITNEDGKTVSALSRYLGHKTNNEAEYWALLLGLREAKRLGGEVVRIFTDSELD